MIGTLPESLAVCGLEFAIDSDFRTALLICQAMSDPELSDRDRTYVALRRLFRKPEELPRFHLHEAAEKAFWFIGGGDAPKSKPEAVRILDWKHDEHMIMPAVSRALNVTDVRSLPYLHWWTFLGAFGEIGEGLLSQVLHIRQKLARKEKLEKYERKFLKRSREIIVLRTPEDDAALRETEEVLRNLI